MVSDRLRGIGVIAASTACMLTAVAAFWYQDWVYALPTPRPDGLHQPAPGEYLPLGDALGGPTWEHRPVVVHVVNVDCPCSRFNSDHIRSLVRRFGDRVRFVALVQGDNHPQILRDAFVDWGIPMEVVPDPGGRLATALGVYSTPQAVVLTSSSRLYFRGNYNVTRYCADRRTEFVRIAIEALLASRPLPEMPDDATVAYGCPLPHRSPRSDALPQGGL
jgi:hypothetical protein